MKLLTIEGDGGRLESGYGYDFVHASWRWQLSAMSNYQQQQLELEA